MKQDIQNGMKLKCKCICLLDPSICNKSDAGMLINAGVNAKR